MAEKNCLKVGTLKMQIRNLPISTKNEKQRSGKTIIETEVFSKEET